MKNDSALFSICLGLFLIVTGCGKSTNSANTEVANDNTVRSSSTTVNGSGTVPLSSSTVAPTPNNSPRTVQVRLTVVETNADLIDSPLANSKVTIKSGETGSNKKTDKDGVVVFDAVACGNEVVITANDEESDEDTVLRRRLECEEAQVDLGVLTRPFGGKFILEQRQTQRMEYDPIKNVWRSEGKIIPNEKVRVILEKYMSK